MIGHNGENDLDLTKAKDMNDQVKKCRMRCEHQSHITTITSTRYPNRNTIIYREDYCLVIQKVVRACAHETKHDILETYYKDTNICDMVTRSFMDEGLCNGTMAPPDLEERNAALDAFVEQYAKDNFAVMKVFIKNPYYTSIIRDQAMTTISFIANSGGLAGLCMGMHPEALLQRQE